MSTLRTSPFIARIAAQSRATFVLPKRGSKNTARFLRLTAFRVALDWCLNGFVLGWYFRVGLDVLAIGSLIHGMPAAARFDIS